MKNNETATNIVANNEENVESVACDCDATTTTSDYAVKNKSDGNPFAMEVEKPQAHKPNGFWQGVLKVLNYIFIDGLSGMAIGLFATLIIGTIIGQIGSWIPGPIGTFIVSILFTSFLFS